jgi:hypothetical protein
VFRLRTTRLGTMIQRPSARDAARGDWRAHPEAEELPAGLPPRDDGPRAEALSRERPVMGAHPETGQPPATSQADEVEPEALPGEGPATGAPPAAAQADGPEAELVSRERPVTGQPPAAAQADGQPEVVSRGRPVTGQPPAAAQADGPEPEVVSRERPATG